MTESPPQGRPSAIQPQVRLERRVSPFFATICYGFLAAIACTWLLIGAKIDPLTLWASSNWLRDIAIGLGAALVLAGGWAMSTRLSPAARELEREFGWILGEQRPGELVYLALVTGVSEELFFRGALHHFIGPLLTTALFAVLHWPVNWSFRLWPVFALFSGAVMAGEQLWTGSLIAPAVTHVAVNGLNLARLARKYRIWKE